MNYLIISIIEALYIIYMFNYYKTTIALDYGFILNILKMIGIQCDFITHHINNRIYKIEEPINMICPFGHFISWFLGLFLILRNFIPRLKKINKYIIILLFIGSWMNINALIYMIPIFICEIFIT